MKLFLTSSPTGAYRSSEHPAFTGFDPSNGMVDELRRYWKENSRCLMITSSPDDHVMNDRMREYFEGVVRDTGLSIACMDLCDGRNFSEAGTAAGAAMAIDLSGYDMVILAGGHVPTQLQFFAKIQLRQALQGFDGIVMGISAGSMNCAEEVYAQPEMPGEAVSPSYQRFVPGLGLTDCRILPHYQAVKGDFVDGMRLFEDITYPDSYGRRFYAIVDGTYLLQTEDRKEIRGEAYLIADGGIRKICEKDGVYRSSAW